jgi:putative ABC transport system ATP-binding protein
MAIGGLERITSGTIRVAGHELAHLSEDDLARFRRDNVGIVFQSFHLIATMTALENVAVPLEFRGLDDAFERARANSTGSGSAIGSTTIRGSCRAASSSGWRLRAPSRRAPRSSWPTSRPAISTSRPARRSWTCCSRSGRDHGTTLLLVTHDRALAESCDRVIEIRDGRITAGGE